MDINMMGMCEGGTLSESTSSGFWNGLEFFFALLSIVERTRKKSPRTAGNSCFDNQMAHCLIKKTKSPWNHPGGWFRKRRNHLHAARVKHCNYSISHKYTLEHMLHLVFFLFYAKKRNHPPGWFQPAKSPSKVISKKTNAGHAPNTVII